MVNKLLGIVIIYVLVNSGYGYRYHKKPKLNQVFAWNQIGYRFDGVCYINNTDFEDGHNVNRSGDAVKDSDRFFIPYNNVPIGFEVYGDRVFITVPRRRYGIPSTLNYVDYHSGQSHSLSPLLKPYPDVARSKELISVYRPRLDECGRLWMVDTGLMEIPDERKQIQPPAIIVFDLKTNEQILKYKLKPSDLVNERSSGGLTSITVDTSANSCDDAYAYINDLATNGIIVFSMKDRDSWRVQHGSFSHDEAAMNFSVAGNVITWQDGVFSIALTEPGGSRKAYYHALVSTKEYAVDTDVLKTKGASLEGHVKEVGNRGPLTQSGSHAYHAATRTILFANVARDAILCWQVDTEMTAETVPIVVQDRRKLVYISDLKIVGDDVWVLVNQIPRIIYSTLNTDETNFYIHRGKIQDLIRGTACDRVKNI